MHGGGDRFETGAVHQRFAGKSCPASPPRALRNGRRQPADKQTGCDWVRLGVAGAVWDQLSRACRRTSSADVRSCGFSPLGLQPGLPPRKLRGGSRRGASLIRKRSVVRIHVRPPVICREIAFAPRSTTARLQSFCNQNACTWMARNGPDCVSPGRPGGCACRTFTARGERNQRVWQRATEATELTEPTDLGSGPSCRDSRVLL